jgi:hypothetical protein
VKILKKANWARNKADWLDPLVAKEDELLGKTHIGDIFGIFDDYDSERSTNLNRW